MAVTTKTVADYGGAATDRYTVAASASINNLPQSNMTWGVRMKRTANGANQFVAGKFASGTAYWYFQIATDYGEGTMLASIGRATIDAFSYSNASNLLALDTWYDVFFTWASGTSDLNIFWAPTGTAVAEVTGYGAASGTGTGAIGADAAADLWLGNVTGLNSPFTGHGEWQVLFSKVLTTAEMLTVQHGWDRNNSAMITAVGSCVGLWQTDNTTSVTDLSGNSNTATGTGLATTTGETILIPAVWAEAPTAVDMTDYLYPGSHGKLRVTTDATSVIVGTYRLLSGFNNQNAISVEVNGAYDSQVLAPAVGKGYVTRSLPAGTGKSISFINGVSSRTGAAGVTDGGISTGVVTMRFNAAVTEVAPTTPTTNIVCLNDSIAEGFNTNPVGQYGPLDLIRRFFAGTPQVLCDGYGGQSLYRLASDATARTNSAARVATLNPTMIFIALGTNDYGNNLWSAAAFETAAAAFLVALNSACPNAVIRVATPATLPSGEGANGSGSTLGNYRTAWVNACASKSYVTVFDGPTEFWDGTNADADNTHPNNTGAAAIFENLKVILEQPAVVGGSPDAMSIHHVFRNRTYPPVQHQHMIVPGRTWNINPALGTIEED